MSLQPQQSGRWCARPCRGCRAAPRTSTPAEYRLCTWLGAICVSTDGPLGLLNILLLSPCISKNIQPGTRSSSLLKQEVDFMTDSASVHYTEETQRKKF